MVEIRQAYQTDAYTLINIKNAVWKSAFYDVLPNGILNEMVNNVDKRVNHLKDQIAENNRIFVALDDGVIVGYVFYAKTDNVVYDAAAQVRDIYILPEYQGKGIGKSLFEKVALEVKRLGYRSLVLYCPMNAGSIGFFLKLGGEKREMLSREIEGYDVTCDLVYYDLEHLAKGNERGEWNSIYEAAQGQMHLLNNINRELAVVVTEGNKMYLGLGVMNRVCPIESAISNMHIGGETKIGRILIMDRHGKPVLPCGKCRDLLIKLGQDEALILFDFGSLKTMSMHELNPYYKDEEKV